MSNRDTLFVGVFPTLRSFILCIQTRITDLENHESDREKICFPFSDRVWYNRAVQPLMMAKCINLWN